MRNFLFALIVFYPNNFGRPSVFSFASPAARRAALRVFFLIFLVIEQEFAGRLQIVPAVGVQDGAVHGGLVICPALEEAKVAYDAKTPAAG
jgi:hypothetical protein